MRGRRGAILAQVLLATMVAALMCSAILRARMQPALTASAAVDRVQDDLSAQAAVNRVNEVWVRLGVCSTDMDRGVRCAGNGCDCNCVLDPAQNGATSSSVTSAAAGGACVLTASRQ
jgi:hypothetical protein